MMILIHIALHVVDFFATKKLVAMGGTELNPFVRFFLARDIFAIAKVVAGAALILFAPGWLWAGNVILGIVVLNNLNVIRKLNAK